MRVKGGKGDINVEVEGGSYSLKKGQLERDYAQALQKLASQYLKRDWPGINPDDQRTDYRNVYAVWRSYLEGTVQVSQSRLNVCDNYKSQVSDPAKTVRLYKEQQLKKTIDQLSGIQAELQESVKELAKAKKKYYDCEQVAHAIREKAHRSQIIQEFNQQLFMQENPVFHKAHDFQFQPSECDTTLSSVQQLVDIEPSPVSAMRMTLAQHNRPESSAGVRDGDNGGAQSHKEARKWATRVAREHKNIIHYKRSLEECESHGLPATEQGRLDLEMKIEDTKENIRKAE
ncbi:hypothetical protein INR49_018745, partial [Caranx melampygus]